MPSRSVSSEIELWDAQLVGGDERRLSPHGQRSHDRGMWVTSESRPRASDENPTTQTSTPLTKMGDQSRSMSADQNAWRQCISDEHSKRSTDTAQSQTAKCHLITATCTTSNTGKTVAPPTSTTWCHSAHNTTTPHTKADGKSHSTPKPEN